MDVNAVRAMWKVYSAVTDNPYHITDNTMWQQVESIEAVDGTTPRQGHHEGPYYPSEGLCASQSTPHWKTSTSSTKASLTSPSTSTGLALPRLASGTPPRRFSPWSRTTSGGARSRCWTASSGVRWTPKQSVQASRRRTGRLYLRGATSYNAVKGQAGTEIRQSQNTNVNIIQLNPKRIEDLALRRAILASVDREQIATRHTSQLGWTEPLPGSIIAMPFQKGYQNNYAGDTGCTGSW